MPYNTVPGEPPAPGMLVPVFVPPPVVVPLVKVMTVNDRYLDKIGFTYSFLATRPNSFVSIQYTPFSTNPMLRVTLLVKLLFKFGLLFQ